MQGLLLDVIQEAAPDAYAKRTKRQGIVNAFDDENFAQAVRDTGEWSYQNWCIREHSPCKYRDQVTSCLLRNLLSFPSSNPVYGS